MIPTAPHIVCFWKQNDLGLFGRRPDRFIAHWEQDPAVQQVLVFEAPTSLAQLKKLAAQAQQLDPTSASEYTLLLGQIQRKVSGRADSGKVRYLTHLSAGPTDGPAYLRWVLQQVQAAGIERPCVVLWPACFVNPALLAALAPSQVVTDYIDDQRLFEGQSAEQIAQTSAQYQWLAQASDRRLCNAAPLIERLQDTLGLPIEHLPNSALPMSIQPRGHGLGDGPSDGPSDGPGGIPSDAPSDAQALLAQARALKTGPVVGYLGNLRQRIDTQALLPIIRRHPQWAFWFVGQTHRSAFYQSAQAEPNVRFWGTRPLAQAQALLGLFDAAIVPFQRDGLVQSMDLIKQTDYDGAGLRTASLLQDSSEVFEQKLASWLAP